MRSILELLEGRPTAQERMSQILGIIQSQQQPSYSGGGTSTPVSSDPGVSSGGGNADSTFSLEGGGQPVPTADGTTQYPYRTWSMPYYGKPGNLVTRRGITLQRGPMHSLMDIARASDLAPGAREIDWILQGFRSQDAQRYAAQHNPNAADYGHSYHPMGLAIDAGEWTSRPELYRALLAAGWNQLPTESWHYSYGVSG